MLIILVIALLIFGPSRIKEVARSIGQAVGGFQREVSAAAPRSDGDSASPDEPDDTGDVEALRQLVAVLRLLRDRITVFVSSVMNELQAERRAASDAIESLLASRPWLFEDHGGPEQCYVVDVCLDAVRTSDILLLIVGTDVSAIVRTEYRTAMDAHKPVLAFVEQRERAEEAAAFLEELTVDGVTWTEFDSIEALKIKVKAGLINHVVKSYKRYGLSAHSILPLIALEAELNRLLTLRAERFRQSRESQNAGHIEAELAEIGKSVQAKSLSSAEDLARKHATEGQRLLAARRFRRAIAEFNESVALDPEQQSAYKSRSACYGEIGDYASALKDADRAVSLAPDDPWAFVWRANSLSGLGRYDDAVAACARVIEIDPEEAAGFRERAKAYTYRKNLSRAIEDATKALELDPQNPLGYDRRADAYLEIGNYRRALADASEAVRLDPSNASWYRSRGYVRSRSGDKRGAKRDFHMARRLEAGDSD